MNRRGSRQSRLLLLDLLRRPTPRAFVRRHRVVGYFHYRVA
jgi:hypothetical protein